ncbi:MAG: LamG-like jellyroll fold domain-containing protein [Kiritimatiellia bacterium]|jgi:hypothetical protein
MKHKGIESAIRFLAATLLMTMNGAATAASHSVVTEETLAYFSGGQPVTAGGECNELAVGGMAPSIQFSSPASEMPAQISVEAMPFIWAGDACQGKTNALAYRFFSQGRWKMADTSALSESFTAEFFFRADQTGFTGTGQDPFVYLMHRHDNFYFLIARETGQLGCQLGEASPIILTQDMRDGMWHHYAITFDKAADTMKAYLDGIQIGEAAGMSWPIASATSDALYLAAGAWGDGLYQALVSGGSYDEFRITTRVLAPGEFLSAGSYPVDADTIAYFNFSDSNVLARTVHLRDTMPTSRRAMNVETFHSLHTNVPCGTLYGNNGTDLPVGNIGSYYGKTDPAQAGPEGNGNAGFGLVVEDAAKLNGTQSFTIETYAKFEVNAPKYYAYFMSMNERATTWAYFFDMSGNLATSVEGVARHGDVNGTSLRIMDGAWHHLAVVYDVQRKQMSFYVDYRLFQTYQNVTGDFSPSSGTPAFLLGGGWKIEHWGLKDGPNEATYDEVRITQRALRVPEFLTDESIVGVSRDLVARYENSDWGSVLDSSSKYHLSGEKDGSVAFSRRGCVSPLVTDVGRTFALTNEFGLLLSPGTVVYPPTGALDGSQGTTEAFLKVSQETSSAVPVLALTSSATTNTPVWQLTAGGDFFVRGTARTLNTPILLKDGCWHHVAVVFEKEESGCLLKLYFDYDEIYSATEAGLIEAESIGVTVGGNGFHGAVDELRHHAVAREEAAFLEARRFGVVLVIR